MSNGVNNLVQIDKRKMKMVNMSSLYPQMTSQIIFFQQRLQTTLKIQSADAVHTKWPIVRFSFHAGLCNACCFI